MIACLLALSAEANPLSRIFGRGSSEFAAQCRRLEREAREFESSERVLLEQLRQMRVTTGTLRSTLRESMKESDAALANATEYIALLEQDVEALKTRLADAEATIEALEAQRAADASALSAQTARADAATKEAVKLKKALTKATGELQALKKAQKATAHAAEGPPPVRATRAPQKNAKAKAPATQPRASTPAYSEPPRASRSAQR